MEENNVKMSVEAQYVKDLSFENPHAPRVFTSSGKPSIDLSLDLNVMKAAENKDIFEVVLSIEATAKNNEDVLFLIDLKYAGLFTVSGVSEENRKIILGVHCPSLLFPFARNIIATTTQSGGYQPLMIDPIDFGALYHSKMREENNKNSK